MYWPFSDPLWWSCGWTGFRLTVSSSKLQSFDTALGIITPAKDNILLEIFCCRANGRGTPAKPSTIISGCLRPSGTILTGWWHLAVQQEALLQLQVKQGIWSIFAFLLLEKSTLCFLGVPPLTEAQEIRSHKMSTCQSAPLVCHLH